MNIWNAIKEGLSMPEPLDPVCMSDAELRVGYETNRRAVTGIRWCVVLTLAVIASLVTDHFWPETRPATFVGNMLIWHCARVSLVEWEAYRKAYYMIRECERNS